MLAARAAFSPLLFGLRLRVDGQGGLACLESDLIGHVSSVHGALWMDASVRVSCLAAYGASRAKRSEYFWLRVTHGRGSWMRGLSLRTRHTWPSPTQFHSMRN